MSVGLRVLVGVKPSSTHIIVEGYHGKRELD
jgi:hypothetical protein